MTEWGPDNSYMTDWFKIWVKETKKQIWDVARRAMAEADVSMLPGYHNGPGNAYTGNSG